MKSNTIYSCKLHGIAGGAFFQKGDEGLKELTDATVIGTINSYHFELRH